MRSTWCLQHKPSLSNYMYKCHSFKCSNVMNEVKAYQRSAISMHSLHITKIVCVIYDVRGLLLHLMSLTYTESVKSIKQVKINTQLNMIDKKEYCWNWQYTCTYIRISLYIILKSFSQGKFSKADDTINNLDLFFTDLSFN